MIGLIQHSNVAVTVQTPMTTVCMAGQQPQGLTWKLVMPANETPGRMGSDAQDHILQQEAQNHTIASTWS